MSSGEHADYATRYHSQSQPDLVSISYEDQALVDYPEDVLKVYRSDQVFKYLLVHKVNISFAISIGRRRCSVKYFVTFTRKPKKMFALLEKICLIVFTMSG